jgi:CBS domain-containing protein
MRGCTARAPKRESRTGRERAPARAGTGPPLVEDDPLPPFDTTDHGASLMINGGFRHPPVVEEGKAVGIVSIRDLMRVALDDRSPRGV